MEIKTYLDFVNNFAETFKTAKGLQLGGLEPCESVEIPAGAPKALLFAPHPDDETIIGGIALRLLRDSKWNVKNVPVTLGSNAGRKQGRLDELNGALGYLGIDLLPLSPMGLDKINPAGRVNDPENWKNAVNLVKDLLVAEQPDVLIYPHELDWNSTHIGVSVLLQDALRLMPTDFKCKVVFTQFWGQIYNPNIMLELTTEHVSDLVAATSFHVEEVRRNPYHLTLPCHMMDAVRRGGEVVGGQGGEPPAYVYATNYLLKEWNGFDFVDCTPHGLFIGADVNPGDLILGSSK